MLLDDGSLVSLPGVRYHWVLHKIQRYLAAEVVGDLQLHIFISRFQELPLEHTYLTELSLDLFGFNCLIGLKVFLNCFLLYLVLCDRIDSRLSYHLELLIPQQLLGSIDVDV